MTRPVPDKAEVAVEFPDKVYIGTFERSARFDAHLDDKGISLSLHRMGADDVRKSVRMHFDYELFAEILQDLAKTARSVSLGDVSHRKALGHAAAALCSALTPGKREDKSDTSDLTADQEVRLLHIME